VPQEINASETLFDEKCSEQKIPDDLLLYDLDMDEKILVTRTGSGEENISSVRDDPAFLEWRKAFRARHSAPQACGYMVNRKGIRAAFQVTKA
jgi:hypothetical protein